MRIIILKARDASSLAADVILAIKYAFAQCSAIFCHTFVQIIVIFIILKNEIILICNKIRLLVKLKELELTLQKHIGLSQPLQPSMQSV